MLFMSLYSNSYLFKQSAKNTKAQSVLLLLPQFCTRALASSKVWILSSGNCRDIYQGDRCDKCQHRSMLKIMTDWNTTRKRKDRSGLYCIVEDDFPTTVTTTAVVRIDNCFEASFIWGRWYPTYDKLYIKYIYTWCMKKLLAIFKECFQTISSVSNFHSCWFITVFQHGKNPLFFYNVAQKYITYQEIFLDMNV